jgi:excisionase family DNA binding protein
MVADANDVVTVREVAKRLKVSRSLVYQMIRRGEIKSVHLGRSVRIPAEELARLLSTGK